MAALSKKEILAELKKLGFNSTSELNSCFKDYKQYYTTQNSYTHSLKEYHEESEGSCPNEGTITSQLAQICLSVFSVLINFLTFLKVKTCKGTKG